MKYLADPRSPGEEGTKDVAAVRRDAGGRQQSLPLQERHPFSTRGCGCCVGWLQQPSACIFPGLLRSMPLVRTGAQLAQRRARASNRKALNEIYEFALYSRTVNTSWGSHFSPLL